MPEEKPKRRVLKRALAVVLALVVLGVGGIAWMVISLKPGIAVAAAAPPVTLLAADGTAKSLSDLRGKTVLLDFWSST
ncbi:MAG: hypothetical protein ACYTDX_03010 [Planctomycetota bacterium]|jgi:cytochrome oxidase Cu insertion factor (SCO1/SenC/PrrC family)